ncbi:MAG: molybdenum cofactor guanylyltransferase [Gudongella sp.]|nr:molybdenum cofactor guanylyltransferase [Gudongella sp.]
MKEFGTAIILAGGKSSRMGFDKQFLKINERLLMDNLVQKLKPSFSEIIIVTNKPEEYKGLPVIVTQDVFVEIGPLAGIHAGLLKSNSHFSYIIACDMPNINLEFIDYMKSQIECSDKKASIARFKEWIEPFNAFYSRDIIEPVEDFLELGGRSINRLLRDLDINFIDEKKAREFSPNWDMFYNLNTKADINEYLEKVESIGGFAWK